MAALATRAGVEGRAAHPRAAPANVEGRDHPPRVSRSGSTTGSRTAATIRRRSGAPCGRCDSCRLRAKGFAKPASRIRWPGSDCVTERLYYTTPYSREFDARWSVVDAVGASGPLAASSTAPRSIRPPVASRSIPASSAPPRVVDVVDGDDGAILHVVEGPIELGARRAARIDWPRRFDHMQQHTGQHVLSAAFDRLLKRQTVSFHLGSTASTIDLAARSRRRRSRAPRTRPIACLGGPAGHDSVCATRMESRRCRCERNRSATACCGWLTSRASTCRRAAGRTSRAPVRSASSRSPRSRSSAVAPGSSSCAAARAGRLSRLRDAVAASVRLSVGAAGRAASGDRSRADRRPRPPTAGQGSAGTARWHEANALAERAEPVKGRPRVVLGARVRGMPTVSSPWRRQLRRGLGTLQSS